MGGCFRIGTFMHLQTSALCNNLYNCLDDLFLLLVTFLFFTIPVEGPVLQRQVYKTTKKRFIHGPKVSGSLVIDETISGKSSADEIVLIIVCEYKQIRFLHRIFRKLYIN